MIDPTNESSITWPSSWACVVTWKGHCRFSALRQAKPKHWQVLRMFKLESVIWREPRAATIVLWIKIQASKLQPTDCWNSIRKFKFQENQSNHQWPNNRANRLLKTLYNNRRQRQMTTNWKLSLKTVGTFQTWRRLWSPKRNRQIQRWAKLNFCPRLKSQCQRQS